MRKVNLSLHTKMQWRVPDIRDKMIQNNPGVKGRHWKLSEQTKLRISQSKKGKPSASKGRSVSQETRRKISDSKKGWNPSAETRKRMSEDRKRRGVLPPWIKRKVDSS